MRSIQPYLNFNGNAESAFLFYKSVFGSEFQILQRFKDMPGAEKMPKVDLEKILHVSLPIAPGYTLMGCDSPENMGGPVIAGNNFHLSFDADSEEDADRIFNALSTKGKVTMQIQKTFWNSYFGMLTDQFGIQWMVSYEYK